MNTDNVLQISKPWSIFRNDRATIMTFLKQYVVTEQPQMLKRLIWSFNTDGQNNKVMQFFIVQEPYYDSNAQATLKQWEQQIWSEITARDAQSGNEKTLNNLTNDNLLDQEEVQRQIEPIRMAAKAILDRGIFLEEQLKQYRQAAGEVEYADEGHEHKSFDELWDDLEQQAADAMYNITSKGTTMAKEISRAKERLNELNRTRKQTYIRNR